MIAKTPFLIGLAAALAAGSAGAAKCKTDKDCSAGLVCQSGTCVAKSAAAPPASTAPATTTTPQGGVNTGRVAWGQIGLYDIGFSVTVPGFGTVSSSSGYFGLNAGAAVNVMQLAPDLPLAAWAQAAIILASGGSYFPLNAGAAVRYDKLPVQILGGLGFTLMP